MVKVGELVVKVGALEVRVVARGGDQGGPGTAAASGLRGVAAWRRGGRVRPRATARWFRGGSDVVLKWF